jgi:hypothetical protein
MLQCESCVLYLLILLTLLCDVILQHVLCLAPFLSKVLTGSDYNYLIFVHSITSGMFLFVFCVAFNTRVYCYLSFSVNCYPCCAQTPLCYRDEKYTFLFKRGGGWGVGAILFYREVKRTHYFFCGKRIFVHIFSLMFHNLILKLTTSVNTLENTNFGKKREKHYDLIMF